MKSFLRRKIGQLARISPIKTTRFGYPNKVLEHVPWLDPKYPADKYPTHVQVVHFLKKRINRNIGFAKRVKRSDPTLWDSIQNFQPWQRYIAVLKGARVSQNTVIGPDNAIIWELSYLWNINPYEHPLLKSPILPREVNLSGKTLFLCVASADNYFHWITDLLQKFKVLEDTGIDYLGFDHYLVNSQHFEFQRESLRIMGVSADKIVETDRIKNLFCETITVPSWADQSGFFDKADLIWLREKLLQNDDYSGTSPPNRFFISRKNTFRRNILNVDDLKEVFKKHGIVSVELENLSFLEQMHLFRYAEIVIGAHGAGLTNIIFCKPHTKVMELVNENYAHQMFYCLATVLELDYFYLVGQIIDKSPSVSPGFQDLIIDVDAIDHALGEWIQQTQ